MTALDALRSATVSAADVLGKDDHGVIASEKLADLVAVQGDPLQDTTATDGGPTSLDTTQSWWEV